jgi:hypothetical protein
MQQGLQNKTDGPTLSKNQKWYFATVQELCATHVAAIKNSKSLLIPLVLL